MAIAVRDLLRGCGAKFVSARVVDADVGPGAGVDADVCSSSVGLGADACLSSVGLGADADVCSSDADASANEGADIASADVEILDITYNSAQVKPGSAFFCIKGFNVDGHKFAFDAAYRGAKLIVAEHEVELGNLNRTNVPIVAIVDDTRCVMARAAANFYGNPSESLKLLGITGTNGKTTTTYILDHILTCAGLSCGIIGTTGNRVGSVMEEAKNTTPESIDMQHLFARMRDAGDEAVVMEVSSHALELYRPYGSKFAVTAFTNLTQDHLDFHKTFEDYFNAKAKLFSADYPARRVVCIDDAWGQRLAQICEEQGDDVLTCGFAKAADIHPLSVEYESDKTCVLLSVRAGKGDRRTGRDLSNECESNDNIAGERTCNVDGERSCDNRVQVKVEYPLVGKFNVLNMMCAFGVALQAGLDVQDIAFALRDLPKVPGRLERISATGEANVFVDYAHTPDAIEKAIASIRELNPARIICVFGCGGDRDAKKRPLMGRAAMAADFAVVTSDNPRTEDPLSIIDDILPGMGEADVVSEKADAGTKDVREDVGASACAEIGAVDANCADLIKEGRTNVRYKVIPDRAEAIRFAINMAHEGDAVLVAGKGHEDYQIIGTEKIHFDDREIVRDVLSEKAKMN